MHRQALEVVLVIQRQVSHPKLGKRGQEHNQLFKALQMDKEIRRLQILAQWTPTTLAPVLSLLRRFERWNQENRSRPTVSSPPSPPRVRALSSKNQDHRSTPYFQAKHSAQTAYSSPFRLQAGPWRRSRIHRLPSH